MRAPPLPADTRDDVADAALGHLPTKEPRNSRAVGAAFAVLGCHPELPTAASFGSTVLALT